MIYHYDINQKELHRLIRHGQIVLAGNRHLKIYGRLDCSTGRRMKKENRVFFANESDAIENGFRPCGSCLSKKYNTWKRMSLS